MTLDNMLARYESLKAEAAANEAEANNAMAIVREAVKRGESTGDAVRDFSIAAIGQYGEKWEKPYRLIEGKLANAQGMPVAVVRNNVAYTGRDGCFMSRIKHDLPFNIQLAKVDGKLSFDKAQGLVCLPTKGYFEQGIAWCSTQDMTDLVFRYSRNGSSRDRHYRVGSITLSANEIMLYWEEARKEPLLPRVPNVSSQRDPLGMYEYDSSEDHFSILVGAEVEQYFIVKDPELYAQCVKEFDIDWQSPEHKDLWGDRLPSR